MDARQENLIIEEYHDLVSHIVVMANCHRPLTQSNEEGTDFLARSHARPTLIARLVRVAKDLAAIVLTIMHSFHYSLSIFLTLGFAG
jgi:hypothetical protein